jgi:HD-GYP domain-containing protein (c-di-GMP phosphodiesterase class II)
MSNITIITLLLIFFGMVVMFLSILKSFSAVGTTDWFLFERNDKIKSLYRLHQLLMIFFLIGYLLVFCFILFDIRIISMIFVGVIFFFGGVFVFLGIFIYSYMLSICKKQHVEVLNRNDELLKTENAVIFMLAYVADLKDYKADRNSYDQFALYAKILIDELRRKPKYSSVLTDEYISNLVKAMPLYNIGKLGISDSILEKEEKLSPEEVEKMKKHCDLGVDILTKAKEKLRINSFFPIAIQIAYSHHENWDGTGYPCGLKSEEIPLSARIISIINVYNKLSSNKYGYSMSEICQRISDGKGTKFDPVIVDAFMSVKDIYYKIYSS